MTDPNSLDDEENKLLEELIKVRSKKQEGIPEKITQLQKNIASLKSQLSHEEKKLVELRKQCKIAGHKPGTNSIVSDFGTLHTCSICGQEFSEQL